MRKGWTVTGMTVSSLCRRISPGRCLTISPVLPERGHHRISSTRLPLPQHRSSIRSHERECRPIVRVLPPFLAANETLCRLQCRGIVGGMRLLSLLSDRAAEIADQACSRLIVYEPVAGHDSLGS